MNQQVKKPIITDKAVLIERIALVMSRMTQEEPYLSNTALRIIIAVNEFQAGEWRGFV